MVRTVCDAVGNCARLIDERNVPKLDRSLVVCHALWRKDYLVECEALLDLL